MARERAWRACPLSDRSRLVAVTRGEAIANVELDASGTRLVASVTIEAVNELGIAEGSAVTAIVKASDVILAVDN